VTKVLRNNRALNTAVALILFLSSAGLSLRAQIDVSPKPAEKLYMELGHLGLDATRVYQVRGASLNRASVQITLDDGIIAFTSDVLGRTTGAFFEGEGEILLSPPNEVERRSMSLFTGMAILEERFETAYFRFNDDAVAELMPDLRQTQNKQEFVTRWEATAKNLANADAMRLLMTFSEFLPGKGAATGSGGQAAAAGKSADRYFHARLQGTKLGVFDVYFDSIAEESVQAGQERNGENGLPYFDVWTSFAPLQVQDFKTSPARLTAPGATKANPISIRKYTIRTDVHPPKQIHANANLQIDVHAGGNRTLLFELSRALKVERVTVDGQPVEFIHNPALEGTQLSRQGNDLMAVVLPAPTITGQSMVLDFEYGGDVLAEAGIGLLYVGARGTWYPNRGMAMADFDLTFNYPTGWTLVATGKPAQNAGDGPPPAEQQVSHWISERPIPLAGFNLGKYRKNVTKAGDVDVETYATQVVEKDFPSGHVTVVEPSPSDPSIPRSSDVVSTPRPSPVLNGVIVGESAAEAIRYYAARFGPFPYSRLALTQMPGRDSQGWPGLVFLSSYAFLSDREREELHFQPSRILIQHMIPAHETAHQWWGDLVSWSTYRDQWLSEGLSNYCALMILQEKNPNAFRDVMQKYRSDLLEKDKDGKAPMDAGPVTLGTRLLSSKFPGGYEAISYGRGTWLFHMLRTMLKDAAAKEKSAKPASSTEEPFNRALKRVRERYEGRAISTQELLSVFAEELPTSLRYEGKKSLDWFLDEWINGISLPTLELKNVKFTPTNAGTLVSGTILQKEGPEDLVTSVPIYAVTGGKAPLLLGRVFADGGESSFRLTAPAGTHKIQMDPFNTILTRSK
jgi:hypothetical protein